MNYYESYAHDIEVANSDGVTIYYNWINNNTELEVTSCSDYLYKYSGDVVIPESVEYGGNKYNVTLIGKMAFNNCSSLYSVTIPNSVASIGEMAFSGCSNLSSLIIENGVTSIGEDAFALCGNITSVTIPISVKSIGYGIFRGCIGLTSIIVESGNDVYDSRDNCNAIIETASNTLISGCTKTKIPNNITSIGDYAFSAFSNLSSITIPDNVTSIGYGAFKGCKGLSTITIPNGVTSIDEEAFEDCINLTTVILPQSLTSLGYLAFAYCTQLAEVYCYAESIPNIEPDSSPFYAIQTNNITLHVPSNAIEAYKTTWPWSDFNPIVALGSDDRIVVINGVIYVINGVGSVEVTGAELGNTTVDILSEVTIGDKTYQVTSIGDRAFEGRSDIDYLSIPYSIKSIGEYAFINCGSNMTVNIEDLASWCQTELGNEHSSPLSSARIVQVNSLVKEKLIIPEGVPYIGNFTFYQCRGISSVTIPSSVKIIGSSAFEDCSGLEKLNISEGLITIGGSSFEGCSSLSTLTIPSTVSTIAINAFKNCMGLKEVYCYAENVPDTHEDAFDVTPTGSSTLYVPAGSVQAYKNSWPWSDFKNIVALGSPTDDDSTISGKCGDNVRYTYNKDNKTLTISGEGAMYDYTIVDASPWSSFADEISSVVIESGVTSIGRRAFTSCGLTSVIIPNTVVSIGDNSFHGCSGLTSVTIPNGVYDIYECAFAGCSLTSLTLPETISKLEEGTFMINSLTSVTIFATNPPKTEGAQVFSNYDIPLYVPAGSEDAYLAKHPWYNFKEILPISESGEESDYKSLLIGKWELIERNGYEHTHVEFKEDGTFSYTSIDRTYYEEHGIFKVEGDILYEWFSDENEWSPSKIVSVDNENLSLQELLDDGITPLGSVDNYRRVSGSSSILNISIDPEIEGVYSIDGVKVNKPRKGINIIKLKDGTTRKVIIKL